MARAWNASTGDVLTTYTTNLTVKTVAIWARRTSNGEGSGDARMWDKSATLIRNNPGNNTYRFEQSASTGGIWEVTQPSLNDWHHICVTYDNTTLSNDPVFYIDGASQSFVTDTNPTGTISTSPAGYRIGNRSDGADSRTWGGDLAEFAIWNVILSAEEVLALGQGMDPRLVRPSGLVCYVPIMGTQATEPDWKASGGCTVLATAAAPHPRIFRPQLQTISLDPPPVRTRYEVEVRADAPIAYWRMDEASGSLADSSGYGYTATATGSPTYRQPSATSDPPDRSILFDADGDYFTIAHAAPLNVTYPFSLECWILPSGLSSGEWPSLLRKGDPTSTGWLLFIEKTGKYISFKSNGTSPSSPNDAVKYGVWNHIVVTMNSAGTTATFYVNGVLLGTGSRAASNPSTTSDLTIGTGDHYVAPMYMDEIAIYNTELSGARVLAHYNAAFTSNAQPKIDVAQSNLRWS